MKKTICFVSDSFIADPQATITGPMVQMYVIGKQLQSRGWEVHYISYRSTGEGSMIESYEGVTIHWVKRIKFFQFLNYFGIRRALGSVESGIFYQRGREVITGFVARHCTTHSKRFVWASSGESGVERGKYQKQLRKKKRPFLKKMVLWLEAVINDRICEYGIVHASVRVVQTESQKQLLKKEFGHDSIVIRSGHAVPGSIVRSQPFKVLWIGSIKAVKRPELFIELAKMCSGLSCEFLMAGQIVDLKLNERILAMANSLKNFEFMGAIPFQESQKVISEAHALVNTTDEGYEGLPNAFVQAWLAGTVTLSLHANPDGMIEKYGLGKKVNDLDEMKIQIAKMIADPEYWSTLSQNAKKFSMEKFSIETITDRFENILMA